MRIYKNGVYRDMTPEEIAAYLEVMENMPTPEERIKDLEEALELLLSGVTE